MTRRGLAALLLAPLARWLPKREPELVFELIPTVTVPFSPVPLEVSSLRGEVMVSDVIVRKVQIRQRCYRVEPDGTLKELPLVGDHFIDYDPEPRA